MIFTGCGWISEYMQYTCAYYTDPAMGLEQAQAAKLHHVCRKLQLKPGDTVVEAGCGWGGLARFMATHYGVTGPGLSISPASRWRSPPTWHSGKGCPARSSMCSMTIGIFPESIDVFVSVGMLEHVGVQQYPILGRTIRNCLKPEGRGLIHSIGRNRPKTFECVD